MDKYSVEFIKYFAVAGGSYLSFDFETLSETTGEFFLIEVRVSATARRDIEARKSMDLRSVAAKAVELYFMGELPDERVYVQNSTVVIDLDSSWYPMIDGEPDGISEFQSFTVVKTKQWLPKSGVGDYNLLAHQEELLREIVRNFKGGKTAQSLSVSRHLGGADIVWGGDADLTYDEETIWEDLLQLATEGLLGIGDTSDNYRTYIITKRRVVINQAARKRGLIP